jgi:hypothetical protein
VDHEIIRFDAGDGCEGGEPTERVEVEAWMFVDDTGENRLTEPFVVVVRRSARGCVWTALRKRHRGSNLCLCGL